MKRMLFAFLIVSMVIGVLVPAISEAHNRGNYIWQERYVVTQQVVVQQPVVYQPVYQPVVVYQQPVVYQPAPRNVGEAIAVGIINGLAQAIDCQTYRYGPSYGSYYIPSPPPAPPMHYGTQAGLTNRCGDPRFSAFCR